MASTQGKPSVCPTCGSDDPKRAYCCLRGTDGKYYCGICPNHAWHDSSPVPAATTAYGMVTHPKWPDPTWDTGIQNSEDDLMSTSLVPEGIPESRVNSPFSNRASAPQAENVPAGEAQKVLEEVNKKDESM